MDCSLLFLETHLPIDKQSSTSDSRKEKQAVQFKSFTEVVSNNNVCGISLSQLPTPCLKGDRLAITIMEDEYALGVEACKHHLHGRVVWSKGTQPLTVVALKYKLMEIWSAIVK